MDDITAIVLAAGQSRRMGRPKMLLPWGKTTVLGQVIATLAAGGIGEILVVTGGARKAVEDEVRHLAERFPVQSIYNTAHAQGGMISSIQRGLRGVPPGRRAALIVLGDQPQVRARTVQRVCEAFARRGASLVVPSYRNRRGHPWLIARPLWEDLLTLRPPQTPRDFLNAHAGEIHYVIVEDEGILQDLDTPEDYRRARPPQE